MATETHPDGRGNGSGEMEFDREIRRRAVFATGVGILGVTLVSMVLMWWFSGFLVEHVRARDLPVTEVQTERQRQIEQENVLRSQTELRVFPDLEWPGDVASPGGLTYDHDPFPPDPDVPAVAELQVAPWIDMEAFLEEQKRIQESVGWDEPESSPPTVHLPVGQVVDWFFRDHGRAREDYLETFPYRPPSLPAGEGGDVGDETAGGSNDRSEESL